MASATRSGLRMTANNALRATAAGRGMPWPMANTDLSDGAGGTDTPPLFARYIGIDYSGAGTADQALPGLRAFEAAAGGGAPAEARPTADGRRHWSRRGLAEWLAARLEDADAPVLVGIDHGLSFPLAYFERHGLARVWEAFLDDFAAHWPTDLAGVRVEDVRRGAVGMGEARRGEARWRRPAEVLAGAKSVFHFDVTGQVAKSTHAGLPFVRALRRRMGGRLHVWPFDGWEVPAGRHALAEAYPALSSGDFPREGRSADAHDAYSIAAWLAREDTAGRLAGWLSPPLSDEARTAARIEGWVLGVGAETVSRR